MQGPPPPLTASEAATVTGWRAERVTWAECARRLGRHPAALQKAWVRLIGRPYDGKSEGRHSSTAYATSITPGHSREVDAPPTTRTGHESKPAVDVCATPAAVPSSHGCRVVAARPVGGAPRRIRVAHATDIHFGSKHCDAKALLDFLRLAHDRGCEAVICTGDILDGFSEKLMHEQRAIGFEDQAKEACEVVAAAPRMPWYAITGNHDGYFRDHVGMEPGTGLATKMREAGVDWHYVGSCYGRVQYAGARLELYHPHGGGATRNAVRRVLNAKVERYEPNDRPHVLLGGHFHKFAAVHAYPENVLCVGGGTFQRRESDFGVRMIHPWDVGGGIVSWTLAADGTVSEFAAEFYNVRPEARGWAA